MVETMNYTPAPAETLDHDVTIEEAEQYFTNYIVNESAGIIANAHVVFADKEYLKAECEPCIELAKLFSGHILSHWCRLCFHLSYMSRSILILWRNSTESPMNRVV